MLFGSKDRFAIECELTDTTRDYFFGKFRVWFGGLPFGDFAAEIISTGMFGAERMWLIGQAPPAPAALANCPAETCIAQLREVYQRAGASEDLENRWEPYDFTGRFPYVRALCLLIPLQTGHRIILGLSGASHDVRLDAGDLDAACLGFSEWVQSQPGYGAGSLLTRRRQS